MLIFSRFRRAKISGMKSVNLLKTEKKVDRKAILFDFVKCTIYRKHRCLFIGGNDMRMREVSTLKIVSLHGVSADVEKYDE